MRRRPFGRSVSSGCGWLTPSPIRRPFPTSGDNLHPELVRDGRDLLEVVKQQGGSFRKADLDQPASRKSQSVSGKLIARDDLALAPMHRRQSTCLAGTAAHEEFRPA